MGDGSGGLAASATTLANASNPPVGTRIEVYWPDDDLHYAGQVESYTSTGETVVLYDDGDKEELDLAGEVWRLEGLRPPLAGKSPVMPSRTTTGPAPAPAQQTADQPQRVGNVVDDIVHPSIAPRTASSPHDQRAAGGSIAGQRPAQTLSETLAAAEAPANAASANAASSATRLMTDSVSREDRMSIDSPEPTRKAKGRKSIDGARGSSSKSSRGLPKKDPSKREIENRSPGNPSKKPKSSRPPHTEEIEKSGAENARMSSRRDSRMLDVQSPAWHEGATLSPTLRSASAVRPPMKNAVSKGPSTHGEANTPSEVLHATSDVRGLTDSLGGADIMQVQSLVEQLRKQLAEDIEPLSKGVAELTPLAKRVEEITPAVALAVKASDDIKKELVPIQKEIGVLKSQVNESHATYAENTASSNKEFKNSVDRLVKDIAQMSTLSKENSSVLAKTVKENDRLSKMYKSLEGKFETLASAVDDIKALVRNVNNKIIGDLKIELPLEHPAEGSKVVENGSVTAPLNARSAQQELNIDPEDKKANAVLTALPVTNSSASPFKSTVSLTDMDGNANSGTQASNMGSRDISQTAPKAVVGASTAVAVPEED